MARARTLTDRDYGRASRAMRELYRPDLSVGLLREILDELLPVLDAQDVSLALNDPTPGVERPMSIWFRHFDRETFFRLTRETPEGHLGIRLFRRSGIRTGRISDIPREDYRRLADSDFVRDWWRESDLKHCLLTQLGTRKRECLGRIVFYRPSARCDFDRERVTLLRLLNPALSQAARRLLDGRVRKGGEEMALVDGAGQVFWMTGGFRFLWNAVDPFHIDQGRVGIPELLDGSPLGRAVGYHVISLTMPEGSYYRPPATLRAYYREGRGSLTASFSFLGGNLFGCQGRVLRVLLKRNEPVLFKTRDGPPAEPGPDRPRLRTSRIALPGREGDPTTS